jgi:hypothetical protein
MDTNIDWFTVLADDRVIGVIPRKRLRAEQKRIGYLHGILIRPATIEEWRKYAPGAPEKQKLEQQPNLF